MFNKLVVFLTDKMKRGVHKKAIRETAHDELPEVIAEIMAAAECQIDTLDAAKHVADYNRLYDACKYFINIIDMLALCEPRKSTESARGTMKTNFYCDACNGQFDTTAISMWPQALTNGNVVWDNVCPHCGAAETHIHPNTDVCSICHKEVNVSRGLYDIPDKANEPYHFYCTECYWKNINAEGRHALYGD